MKIELSLLLIIIVLSVLYPSIAKTNSFFKEDTNEYLLESVNLLDDSDFAVSDGVNTIELDCLYAPDFKTTEIEIKSENNYVGEIYLEDSIYKVYSHEFEDFVFYTSNLKYDRKNRAFDEYYISQITLKNSNYKTKRGISVGSTTEDIISEYGLGENVISGADTILCYYKNDMVIEFVIDNENKVKDVTLLITRE